MTAEQGGGKEERVRDGGVRTCDREVLVRNTGGKLTM